MVASKQRVRAFKSGSKVSSFVDFHRLIVINKALVIDVTVYSNLDVAVRVYTKFSLKANTKLV